MIRVDQCNSSWSSTAKRWNASLFSTIWRKMSRGEYTRFFSVVAVLTTKVTTTLSLRSSRRRKAVIAGKILFRCAAAASFSTTPITRCPSANCGRIIFKRPASASCTGGSSLAKRIHWYSSASTLNGSLRVTVVGCPPAVSGAAAGNSVPSVGCGRRVSEMVWSFVVANC